MSDSGLFRGVPKVVAQPKEDEVLPEPLKGKSPAEVFKILQAEHVSEMAQQDQDYTTRLEQVIQRVERGTVQPSVAPQQPFGFVPPPDGQQEAGFDIANPEEYLNRQVDKRLQPLVAGMVASGRESGREILKGKLPTGYWDKYGEEIEQFVDTVNPQLQANPKIYGIANNFVRGQHVDEIVEERVKDGSKKVAMELLAELGVDRETITARIADRENISSPAPRASLFQGRTGIPVTAVPRSGSVATGSGAGPKLSAAEKAMAAKFDMTEAEYYEQKQSNTDLLSQMGQGA